MQPQPPEKNPALNPAMDRAYAGNAMGVNERGLESTDQTIGALMSVV